MSAAARRSASGTASPSSSCKPPLMVLTRRDWRGTRAPPADGGVVVVANHISHFDPLTFAHFLYDNGRLPRFLAKAALFTLPVRRVGCCAAPGRSRSTASRRTRRRRSRAAVDAVRAGRVRRDLPGGHAHPRPRAVADGRARPARPASRWRPGAPVIPVAQWGPQEVLPPYGKRPHLFPRKTMHVRGRAAGRPVRRPGPAGRRRRCCTRRPSGSWPRSPRCSRRSAARRRRPSASTRAAPACRVTGDPTPADAGRDTTEVAHDARRGARHRVVGHRVRDGARRRRLRRRAVGPARRRSSTPSPGRHENPDYLPGHRRCPRRVRATADPAEALDGAEVVVLAVPVADPARATSASGSRCCRDDCVLVSLMKGIELGTTRADERGDRRGDGCRPERVAVVSRAEPGPGDRPAAAGGQRRRLHRRGGRREAAAGLPDAVLPAVHEHRRRRRASSAARSRT